MAIPHTPKAKQAQVAERRVKAVQLRLAGLQWDEIANRLGYKDRATACKDVTRALERNSKQLAAAADEYRATELARLDRIQAGLWQDAIQGDVKAADAVLKIMNRRAKYLGLDAPQKVEVRTEIDGEISRLLAELGTSGEGTAPLIIEGVESVPNPPRLVGGATAETVTPEPPGTRAP